MPQPSSLTRMDSIPPPVISTLTRVAPASSAFSTSSLTMEAGRSMTSPAAMRAATSGGRTRMGIGMMVARALGPVAPRTVGQLVEFGDRLQRRHSVHVDAGYLAQEGVVP